MKKTKLWLCTGALFVVSAVSVGYYLKSTVTDAEECEENEEAKEKGLALTGIDRQLATWLYTKGYPDPSGLSDKYLAAWQQHLELKKNTAAFIENNSANRIQTTTGFGNWSAFGPKVFGGRILTMAINPLLNLAGNNTIWAGSASGGIWRSYSGGAGATAWHPVATGSPVLGVASIAIHPTDTNTVIAGTGEVYRIETVTSGSNSTDQVGNLGRAVWKCRGTYGVGILKTTNGGESWTHVYLKNSSDLFGIQKVKFDPNNGNKVYACATDGLYRSLDGGNTWTNIYPAVFVSDIAINPANSDQIVFSIGNMTNTVKGIWRTMDGFATAPTQLTTGLPTAFKGFITFDFQGTTLAAAYSRVTAPDANELYTSTNFGNTWTKRTNTSFSGGQYWIAHDVELNSSGTTAIVAGVECYTYTFASNALTQFGNGTARMNTNIIPGGAEGLTNTYVHDDVHDVEYLPGSTTTFLVATDGGIFKTTNSGTSFTSMNGGLQVHQFYSPSAQSPLSAMFIGGLQDNNTIKYDGTDWMRIVSGDGGPALFKPNDQDTVITSRDARNILHSVNSGVTNTQRLANMGQAWLIDEKTCFMAPIAVSKQSPDRWYVASDNLHVSTDGGFSFSRNTQASITGASGVFIEREFKPGFAMGVSSLDANKLYVSMSPLSQEPNDYLYFYPPATIRKSTNGGTSFSTVSSGLPDRYVTDFAISETYDDSVFITLGGFGTSHIYVSGNGGASWSPLASGLPDVPFNSIMIDPVDPKILYAGSDFGVYVSPDRGNNWLDFNSGLWDATYVVDLVAAPGNKIKAVTHGKGIFESSLYVNATLPVKIVSFNGSKQHEHNMLQWSVTDEYNLSHYVLERSLGDNQFEPLASIRAVNKGSYSYTDTKAAAAYYYRLRAVNNDGSYTFSNVVLLDRQLKQVLQVFGNPFRDQVHLRLTQPGLGRIRINLYDIKGRLIRTEQIESYAAQTQHHISGLAHLPTGMYQLEAVAGRNRWTEKLIKR